MSDETKAIDTRELSRSSCSCGPADAHDHMMATEVGSLQRIADSLERLEWLSYSMLLQSMGGAKPELDDAAQANLRAIVDRGMPGVPAGAHGQESEPSEASELESDRPDHHEQAGA